MIILTLHFFLDFLSFVSSFNKKLCCCLLFCCCCGAICGVKDVFLLLKNTSFHRQTKESKNCGVNCYLLDKVPSFFSNPETDYCLCQYREYSETFLAEFSPRCWIFNIFWFYLWNENLTQFTTRNCHSFVFSCFIYEFMTENKLFLLDW